MFRLERQIRALDLVGGRNIVHAKENDRSKFGMNRNSVAENEREDCCITIDLGITPLERRCVEEDKERETVNVLRKRDDPEVAMMVFTVWKDQIIYRVP